MTHPETGRLAIEAVPAARIRPSLLQDILAMCGRAYGSEEIPALYAAFQSPVHVVGYLDDGSVATHAMWVTRWLQAGDGPLLRTAYVELVATDPRFQRRGLASLVMRRLQENVREYDLAALWPNYPDWYRDLGWVNWRGRLFIRGEGRLIPTPADRLMIYRLPRTPPLDLDDDMSAEWRPGELW